MLDEKVWVRTYSPYTGATETVQAPVLAVLTNPEAYLMPDVLKVLARVSRYLLVHSEQIDAMVDAARKQQEVIA